MTEHRLISDPRADLDVEAAFDWYESERDGLGLEFLDELRAAMREANERGQARSTQLLEV